jgi:TRAP-type C4-dicarboxylate transport system permease small subunit
MAAPAVIMPAPPPGSVEPALADATLVDPTLELDSADADAVSPPEDALSRLGRWASEWITVGLFVMMGVEMVVRSLFGWSIQWSNEVGGYALVAITFLMLGSGLLLHAYHRVHFLDTRLSPAANAALRLVFDLGAAVVTGVLLYEFVRFEWITWNSGDVAATSLMTPLWAPRLMLPLGLLLLANALLRTLAGDLRRLRAALHTPR